MTATNMFYNFVGFRCSPPSRGNFQGHREAWDHSDDKLSEDDGEAIHAYLGLQTFCILNGPLSDVEDTDAVGFSNL